MPKITARINPFWNEQMSADWDYEVVGSGRKIGMVMKGKHEGTLPL
jgi:hypothetical protein